MDEGRKTEEVGGGRGRQQVKGGRKGGRRLSAGDPHAPAGEAFQLGCRQVV